MWRTCLRIGGLCLALHGLGVCVGRTVAGAEVTLKRGMTLVGGFAELSSVNAAPKGAGGAATTPKPKLIVLIDDGLRRMFVSSYQINQVQEQAARRLEEIGIPQRVATGGQRVAMVGQLLAQTPFDAWGRQTLTLRTSRGVIDVIVGITKITPVYTQVEGLAAQHSYQLDMRIATSSIPREILNDILTQKSTANADERLKVVRLFIESERYEDALGTLSEAIQAFPELENLQQQEKELRQLQARQVIAEIRLRAQAGQYELARQLAEQFPSEGIAGPILQEVKELVVEDQSRQQQSAKVLTLLDQALSQLPAGVLRQQAERIAAEIKQDLNAHSLPRMADLLRLAQDSQTGAEQQISLAVSGWLLGSGAGTESMAISLSLIQVRDLVLRYLRSADAAERREVLDLLQSLEGATPENVARMVLHLRPPAEGDDGAEPAAETPGQRHVRIPGLPEEPDVEYDVQLPPEYNPYRRYPTVVTLHGEGSTPAMQLDWWAGAFDPQRKLRLGQATRRGYIVIAPHWGQKNQKTYEYSAREHARVLYSVRDACRRFSIDVDRVFLSGHAMGGTAAWDIGLAHPDLWAGVMPIVAVSQYGQRNSPLYVTHYTDNAKFSPWYFVGGELDGRKLEINGTQFDRYLTRTGYDVVYAEFIGRGHEHFSDEIHRLFTWMGLQQRIFPRAEFNSVSLRPWDNFFWWAEVEGLPKRTMVLPDSWPAPPQTRAAVIEGKIRNRKSIYLRSGAQQTTVCLSPDLVDFSQQLEFRINGQSTREQLTPNVGVLLEDVRTRGDRQHPFWAKKVFGNGNK